MSKDLTRYLSDIMSSELFLTELVSVEKEVSALKKSSVIGRINDESSGSGAVLDEETR